MKLRNEYLLNNILDEKFHSVLLPLRFMLNVCCLARYKIADKFITPNSKTYNILSFFCLFSIIFLYSYRMLYKWSHGFSSSIYKFSVIFDYIYFVSFLIMFYIANFIYSLDSVQMILNLQGAHKILKFQYINFRNLIYCNWFYVASLFVFYALIILSITVIMGKFDIIEVGFMALLLHFDITIVESNQMIVLINKEMKYWLCEFKVYSELCNEFRFSHTLDENRDEEIHWESIYEAYRRILRAFGLFKNIYQLPVSSNCEGYVIV